VDGKTAPPTHRDRAAMNGAHPQSWLTIEGDRIDAWATCHLVVKGTNAVTDENESTANEEEEQ